MFRFTIVPFLILAIAFGQTALTTAQIAKRVSPSVVVIRGKTGSGDVLGSGFIVSKDGKIVTNLHVIRDMNTANVQLGSGDIFDSISVLAVDERRDLAIIKVAGFNLTTLELGNSDTLTVGEPVVVVGSPLGLDATVTAGILSAVRDSGQSFKLLQTDAAINHGNSGGPLASASGLAVGVVSSALRSDSAQGLNFAIPINYVRGLLDNLHAPITLEQMRRNLVDTASGARQGGGPSLKETLDWLRETLPLAANHYALPVRRIFGVDEPAQDVTLRTIPVAFESCTVSFDFIETRRTEKYRDYPTTHTTRQTIPLGALTGGSIKKDYANQVDNTIGRWWVFLDAASKVVLSETHEGLHDTTQSEGTSYAFLVFFEESVAQRVLDALKHAADLCRGREAF
jgi:hypothetical protein